MNTEFNSSTKICRSVTRF